MVTKLRLPLAQPLPSLEPEEEGPAQVLVLVLVLVGSVEGKDHNLPVEVLEEVMDLPLVPFHLVQLVVVLLLLPLSLPLLFPELLPPFSPKPQLQLQSLLLFLLFLLLAELEAPNEALPVLPLEETRHAVPQLEAVSEEDHAEEAEVKQSEEVLVQEVEALGEPEEVLLLPLLLLLEGPHEVPRLVL
jgi:hypothetical protein